MKILIAVLAALGLAGCATLSEGSATQRLAVQYATLKVIEADPERAARVVEIVTEARQYVADTDATVSALVGYVEGAVRWEKLDAADTLLVRTLVSEIELQLLERVGDGVLGEETRVRVLQVLDWVIAVAG